MDRIHVPPPDQLQASAVRYLIDGRENDSASILLSCKLTIERLRAPHGTIMADVTLRAPRSIYDLTREVEAYRTEQEYAEHDTNPISEAKEAKIAQIESAIRAVMPATIDVVTIRFAADLVELDEDWRRELVEIARGKAVHNQATEAERVLVWSNHRFRSQAEIHIAVALETAKVLFLPNCKARLGLSKRENREPDFLVCHKGKWGILEVDGEPFHPAARTVEDHERDRLFLAHGVKLVQHFDAAESFENPDKVVRKFLFLLESA